MDILKPLTDKELAAAYAEVFREAFPPEELKPLSSITRMIGEGQYDVLGLFRDGQPLGYICCWLDGQYILIDYLCVEQSARNGGIGAGIIEKVREYYPSGTVFIGEVEAPTGDAEADSMIYRRLGFYERCGARLADYDCALFGVHYKTIVWSGGAIDAAEVCRRHDGFYRRNFAPELYSKAIQLPLREGEKPFSRANWDESPDSEREDTEI